MAWEGLQHYVGNRAIASEISASAVVAPCVGAWRASTHRRPDGTLESVSTSSASEEDINRVNALKAKTTIVTGRTDRASFPKYLSYCMRPRSPNMNMLSAKRKRKWKGRHGHRNNQVEHPHPESSRKAQTPLKLELKLKQCTCLLAIV